MLPGLPRSRVLLWRETTPHSVNPITISSPQRDLGITVQCKTEDKKEAPKQGTDCSGLSRVDVFRGYLDVPASTVRLRKRGQLSNPCSLWLASYTPIHAPLEAHDEMQRFEEAQEELISFTKPTVH
jgi:hypothetical protein